MNRQDIFNQVVAHARQQGKKCVVGSADGESCLYRGPGCLKCFMGVMIEDNEFRSWMEGMDIQMVLNNYRCPQTLIDRLDAKHNGGDFLNRLQTVHDNWSVEEWGHLFQGVAQEYNLEYRVP